jgi:prephenate dehydrogenase
VKELTIGIIGGTGGMGKWLKGFFEDAGYRVLVAGRHTSLKPVDLAGESDVVISSVPINVALTVVKEIAPRVGKDAMLMDVTSLKAGIMKTMLKHARSSVIGTHPLFGPTANSIKNQTIVVCPGRGDQWLAWLTDLLREKGARIKVSTPEEHDQMMSIVQGLTHLSTIALAQTIRALDVNLGDCMEYATPVYRLKMYMIGRLFAQNLGLYADLEIQNAHSARVAEAFMQSVQRVGRIVQGKDNHRLRELLDDISDFLGDFKQAALDEASHLFVDLLDKQSDSSRYEG